MTAISEGHGDAALMLLKAGAETDLKDGEGQLAIDLAPDTKVSKSSLFFFHPPPLYFPTPAFVFSARLLQPRKLDQIKEISREVH